MLDRDEGSLAFEDPEGLRHELAVSNGPDEPLVAEHPEIPAELALQGFDAVRAYAREPERAADCSRTLSASRPERRTAGKHGVRVAAVSTRTTPLPPREASAERGRCTTSRGRRRWRITRAGTSASPRPALRPTPDHRPLLVPLDLLPRAERRPLRDRHARAGLRSRRGSGAPRRVARPPARVRASARPGRARTDAHPRSAPLGQDRVSETFRR